jgi:hypothetical protein
MGWQERGIFARSTYGQRHVPMRREDKGDEKQDRAETRHPTFLGDVRKLVKIPKSMGFPVDAVRLENQGVLSGSCHCVE